MGKLRRNYPIGSLYSGELKYICDECNAVFKNEGCSCGRGALHSGEENCILCEVKKKQPSLKLTQDQIEEKKTTNKRKNG